MNAVTLFCFCLNGIANWKMSLCLPCVIVCTVHWIVPKIKNVNLEPSITCLSKVQWKTCRFNPVRIKSYFVHVPLVVACGECNCHHTGIPRPRIPVPLQLWSLGKTVIYLVMSKGLMAIHTWSEMFRFDSWRWMIARQVILWENRNNEVQKWKCNFVFKIYNC